MPTASSRPNGSSVEPAIWIPRTNNAEKEHQHKAGADEAELLADHGEDGIGIGHRQQELLRAGAQSTPGDAAGAQGDLGLGGLIAGVGDLGVAREEGQHPRPLILVHGDRNRPGPPTRRAAARPDAGGGTPATNSMASPTAAMVTAVPRSGSATTGSTTAASSPPPPSRPMRQSRTRSPKCLLSLARARIRASLPNSLGCSVKSPMTNQRRAASCGGAFEKK